MDNRYLKRIVCSIKRMTKIGSDPDFLIIGAQKAGTTSLFNYIKEYAENFVSPYYKELYFFTENYYRGIDFYRAFFPVKLKGQITGEATPDYLFYHKTPKLVKKHYPHIKLVVILRDPIYRAYSQYCHQNFTYKTMANDPLSFSDAIMLEEKRFYVQEESKFFYEYKYYSYKKRGIYYEQLDRWFSYFDRSQFFILEISELGNKERILELFDFLGLKPKKSFKNAVLRKFNTNVYRKSIKKEDFTFLRNFFCDKNQKLFRLLGKEYNWE